MAKMGNTIYMQSLKPDFELNFIKMNTQKTTQIGLNLL